MGNTLLHAYGGASTPVVEVHNAGAGTLPYTGGDLFTLLMLAGIAIFTGALMWYAGRPR